MAVRFVITFVYYSLSLVLFLLLIVSIATGDWDILVNYGFNLIALFRMVAL